MDSQPSHPSRPHLHSQSHSNLPPLPTQLALRTANTTPASSPGPFSPSNARLNMSFPSSEGATPVPTGNSPLLHPLQHHKVRETHKALVDTDYLTGRKVINRYEIIDELGRGVHGKVKLARNKETGENVAIKIIPRFSKKRKLGKISTVSNNRDKSKREIAILKKIRHPNVVALLEVIDDPELSKIYMVLEHVELGEVVWRKKGLPRICAFERRRVEREMRGEQPTEEETIYEQSRQRLQAVKDAKRARMSQAQNTQHEYWSLEYGTATDDEDNDFKSRSYGSLSQYIPSRTSSLAGSRATSRAPSRNQSYRSISRAGTPHPSEPDQLSIPNEDDLETPGNLRSNPASSTALDVSMAPGFDEASFRGRSPSMADSIISHMSSLDYNQLPDPYADDFSYVPCFTIETARSTFRDTVLGLEYLHYEGIIHRDIKPANLLWTRDHRVKISDFGVSYFGRPIRDGEPDETVSESEAQDFDNDLELAKTVGTPAFFAPELCYTDSLDALPGQSQPKITEQIDVWSLGVTLYCLIFARIPFLAEDEWQMFRKIATEEVYIPTRRLKPVDPATKPLEKSLYTRYNHPPYRDDNDLAYEDIEPELQDLLRRMLTKHPDKRIRLREVKRHAWVTKDLPNVVGWIDDTDPSRQARGQKIHVDAREMEEAVVPISIFERARSAVKKAVDKVMHPRGDRAESSSRKRATSSVGGSGESTPVSNPSTPFPRDREVRRRSLRGDRRADDYFASLKSHQSQGEHPLTHSVMASPLERPVDGEAPPLSDVQQTLTESRLDNMVESLAAHDSSLDKQSRQESHKPLPPLPQHSHIHSRSISTAFPGSYESRTVPATPCFDGSSGSYDDPSSALRKARDMRPPSDDVSRARSVDRASLFANSDKRAEAKVSLSTAVVPGSIQLPPRPPALRSGGPHTSSIITQLVSPLSSNQQSRGLAGYQQSQLKFAPSVREAQRTLGDVDERPTTAHRIPNRPGGETLPTQGRDTTSKLLDGVDSVYSSKAGYGRSVNAGSDVDAAKVPCPPSPDDEMTAPQSLGPSRDETIGTVVSSNSTSLGNLSTPLTSPSEAASPISIANPMPFKGHNAEQILAFQSDPSLPALLSSTSSVSADLEGEFLGNPGVPSASSVLESTDSLTPPALAKVHTAGFPVEAQEELLLDGTVAVELDNHAGKASHTARRLMPSNMANDDDDDSDSDEGLTMGRSRNHNRAKDSSPGGTGRILTTARRRDTNCSVKSTDTAKKMIPDSG
ncbi:kinase-like protein [Coniochaeta ligniaria NRRL 30616]|uniref:non-specific serine/threonine protein kinase n=1 Tax=Coniochaeta ligniaria NRRL 30616 TaxID=1408157 RepID=A0A1J7J324_9PEZI|nr:kinase-like protein [Coniochaeta ligniaria NRRL 30616]